MIVPTPDAEECSWGIIPVQGPVEAPRFLVVQHREGHWGFPKGHAKRGESPLATALRELFEETALRPAAVNADICFSESYRLMKKGRWLRKTVTYFPALITASATSIDGQEIQDAQWLPREQAIERLSFPESQAVLVAVQQHLNDLFHPPTP